MKRRLIVILILLLLAALTVWTAKRWEAWFGNPKEAPYTVSAVPTRVLLTFGDGNGATSRNISWMCDTVVRASGVELIEADGTRKNARAHGELFRSRSGKAAYYVARLRHLKRGHSYRYRVITGKAKSAWYSFTMPSPDHSKAAFLYLGDIQDTLGGITNQLLRKAYRQNRDAEFVVCGGDLAERPTDAWWAEAFRSLDSIDTTLPVLTVTGNHDYLKGITRSLERRFSLIHSYFLDSEKDGNQVFTVNYKDIQLFCLDSNREFWQLWKQRTWLDEQMKNSTAKWKIVVLHHPLYSIRGTRNLIQRWVFDNILRKNGADLVLQGHEHAYARMTMHKDNGTPTTPIYTVSHCSPKNYMIEFPDRVDKFGTGSRYYQMVRTSGDTLFLTARDALDGSLYDSLLVVKTAGGSVTVSDAGKAIPEKLTFTPRPNKSKDKAFAKRIEERRRLFSL